MSLTEEISRGKIRNVSILDLPAFGSKKINLDGLQTNDPNWPNELNFHFINSGSGNISDDFIDLKEITHKWNEYMNKLIERGSNLKSQSPHTKILNPFDYPKYILQDFETILNVFSGSHATALKHNTQLWHEVAKAVFKDIISNNVVGNKGVFDKSIIQCSFKKRMVKFQQKNSLFSSGCELFQRTLTNNGVCYSFNALKSFDVWRESKVLDTFHRNLKGKFHNTLRNYAGAGANEGNYYYTAMAKKIHLLIT